MNLWIADERQNKIAEIGMAVDTYSQVIDVSNYKYLTLHRNSSSDTFTTVRYIFTND